MAVTEVTVPDSDGRMRIDGVAMEKSACELPSGSDQRKPVSHSISRSRMTTSSTISPIVVDQFTRAAGLVSDFGRLIQEADSHEVVAEIPAW